MTAEPLEDLDLDLTDFERVEVPCDGPRFLQPDQLTVEHPTPAEWIGLKSCGHHRVVCSECKDYITMLQANWPYWHCTVCDTGGLSWLGFEPLHIA